MRLIFNIFLQHIEAMNLSCQLGGQGGGIPFVGRCNICRSARIVGGSFATDAMGV